MPDSRSVKFKELQARWKCFLTQTRFSSLYSLVREFCRILWHRYGVWKAASFSLYQKMNKLWLEYLRKCAVMIMRYTSLFRIHGVTNTRFLLYVLILTTTFHITLAFTFIVHNGLPVLYIIWEFIFQFITVNWMSGQS